MILGQRHIFFFSHQVKNLGNPAVCMCLLGQMRENWRVEGGTNRKN